MSLAERYRSVQERIAAAAAGAGRQAEDVNLVVVTKNHPAELVIELHSLGQRAFGENRDQEAAPKAARVLESGISDASWHFVGQLQSNKVKSVLGYADVIHSIDRPSLVKELAKQLPKSNRRIGGFIELNLTDNPERGGVLADGLLPLAEQVLTIDSIDLLGVMAVASLGGDARADFERTRELSAKLQQLAPSATALSMGMSDDFELAIDLGATHIRVGSAITGPRPNNA